MITPAQIRRDPVGIGRRPDARPRAHPLAPIRCPALSCTRHVRQARRGFSNCRARIRDCQQVTSLRPHPMQAGLASRGPRPCDRADRQGLMAAVDAAIPPAAPTDNPFPLCRSRRVLDLWPRQPCTGRIGPASSMSRRVEISASAQRRNRRHRRRDVPHRSTARGAQVAHCCAARP